MIVAFQVIAWIALVHLFFAGAAIASIVFVFLLYPVIIVYLFLSDSMGKGD